VSPPQPGVELFARGRLGDLGERTLTRLLDRAPSDDPKLADSVAGILADVRGRGDAALLEMAARFDGVKLEELEVPRSAWEAAVAALAPDVRAAPERAAANIRSFHAAQLILLRSIQACHCAAASRHTSPSMPPSAAVAPHSVTKIGSPPVKAWFTRPLRKPWSHA